MLEALDPGQTARGRSRRARRARTLSAGALLRLQRRRPQVDTVSLDFNLACARRSAGTTDALRHHLEPHRAARPHPGHDSGPRGARARSAVAARAPVADGRVRRPRRRLADHRQRAVDRRRPSTAIRWDAKRRSLTTAAAAGSAGRAGGDPSGLGGRRSAPSRRSGPAVLPHARCRRSVAPARDYLAQYPLPRRGAGRRCQPSRRLSPAASIDGVKLHADLARQARRCRRSPRSRARRSAAVLP